MRDSTNQSQLTAEEIKSAEFRKCLIDGRLEVGQASQLCDLALLGLITREMWGTERFQPSAETMWEARKAFKIAEQEYIEAEHKRQRGDFDERYPGIF